MQRRTTAVNLDNVSLVPQSPRQACAPPMSDLYSLDAALVRMGSRRRKIIVWKSFTEGGELNYKFWATLRLQTGISDQSLILSFKFWFQV